MPLGPSVHANRAAVEGSGTRLRWKYLPTLLERFAPKDLAEMYYWHALSDGWERTRDPDFLVGASRAHGV